jgi:hypothetical protein
MSSFPNLSNISGYVRSALENRVKNPQNVSQLNAWVRVSSGVGAGLVLLSNPDFALFRAAGATNASIYGDGSASGTLGTTWAGGAVYAEASDSGYRPKPNITSIEIDEGAGTLSRKASFTITCYTKGQLDTLSEYFLEPGYTIFLEWGWNVSKSLKSYSPTLNSTTVANFQSFKIVNEARAKSGGTYDNYLGFITGGGLASSGDTYEITVKCTGFTELPAYFMGADNSETNKDGTPKITEREYSTAQISGETDLGKKRFMMAFNRLPSNRRTTRVSSLITNPLIASPSNFINVDESVKAKVNELTTGTTLFGITLNNEEQQTDGAPVEYPAGTEIIKDEAFIRFGTLMEVLNQIGIEGFKIGDKIVKTRINTKNTACCAFRKIFSTDRGKLFIPNKEAPKFSIAKAASSDPPKAEDTNETEDCSILNVRDTGKPFMFPALGDISNGVAMSYGIIVQNKSVDAGSIIGLEKKQGQWGLLDDLYVNLEFAKGVMETKNFTMRNALYQILNGMSSAAGGLWDFQIMSDEDDSELRVVDLNLTPTGPQEPFTFTLAGYESIFIDAALDMDISGAKMNQIIGNRLSQSINGSQKDVKGKKKGLFTDKEDQVLNKIQSRGAPPVSKNATLPEGPTDDDLEQAKIKNLQLMLDKTTLMPKPQYDDKYSFGAGDLKDDVITVSFNDQAVFEFFKNQNDGSTEGKVAAEVGPIMPIKFTFTIHGISGIKRGDKFKVLGLPKNYEQTGFFQVTAVKHTITDMLWKTDIEGSFRQSR